MTIACQGFEEIDGGLLRCFQPAVAQYRLGCIHEQISERWLCEVHEELLSFVAYAGCLQCSEQGRTRTMIFQLLERVEEP